MFEFVVDFVLFFLGLGMLIGFAINIPQLIKDKKFKKDLARVAKAFAALVILLMPGGFIITAIYAVYFKKKA